MCIVVFCLSSSFIQFAVFTHTVHYQYMHGNGECIGKAVVLELDWQEILPRQRLIFITREIRVESMHVCAYVLVVAVVYYTDTVSVIC